MNFLQGKLSGKSRYDHFDKDTKSLNKHQMNFVILGLDQSGKSTLIKQIKFICENCNADQRLRLKETISNKILTSFLEILVGMENSGVRLADQKSQIIVDVFKSNLSEAEGHKGLQDFASAITLLWNNEQLRSYFDEKISDKSIVYFFDSLDKISSIDYLPSDEDIQYFLFGDINSIDSAESFEEVVVRNKKITQKYTSINKKNVFEAENMAIVQKSQMIIFCVSLDDYDVMGADGITNKLEEAKYFLKQILSTKSLKYHSVLLLFTKKDLFEEKLKTNVLSKGGNNYEDACRLIRGNFVNDPVIEAYMENRFFTVAEICTRNCNDIREELLSKKLMSQYAKYRLDQCGLK